MADDRAAMLEVRNLFKTYTTRNASRPAVDGISFAVRAGEFFTLLGPSGCGKTTTLRCVAGLEAPQDGAILIDGKEVFSSATGTLIPTNKRDISMVFQSYAVWPHMTVAGNVAFPLEALGIPRGDIRRRVMDALDIVGLADFADRPATQLSGGQQQRVAFARAIVKNAKVLLLDEPLSNLDAQLREQMRAELHSLHAKLGTTTLYVTHDQDEALRLSDRVALIRDGKIIEMDSPRALYLSPEQEFTARFIGQGNIWDCTIHSRLDGAVGVDSPLGAVMAKAGALTSEATRMMVRPEHISLLPMREQLAENEYRGRVVSAGFSGRTLDYTVEVNGTELRVQSSSAEIHEPGKPVIVFLPPDRCVLLRV
jgi:iron(III) transport system ATP-binding protein